MTLYRPGETDAARYIPPAVSGFFPTDLFNTGKGNASTGQTKTSPNITQDVVSRDENGSIIYWRMIIEDARGGLNRTRGRFDEDYDRISSSDADARFYRYLILPSLTYTQTSPTASGTITGIHSAMFNDKIHISLGSTSPATVNFETGLAKNLVAWWSLDEASGNALDSHTGDHDLTETGGTIASVAAKVGNGRDFEAGDTEWFEATDDTWNSITGDMTICGWFQLESDTSASLVSKYTATGNESFLVRYNSGTDLLVFTVSADGTLNDEVTASTFGVLSLATQYFFCVRHRNGNNIGISINAGTEDTLAHTTGLFNSAAAFILGAHEAGTTGHFDGILDEVAVWNRVLSDDEVSFLYNGGSGKSYADAVTNAGERAAAQVYRITGWHGTTPPEDGTAATGSSTTPNPPSVTASWGSAKNLFITAYGADVNNFSVTASAPTDYTDGNVTQSDVNAAAAAVVSAVREETDDDDDPGTFTLDSSEEWVANTVVVRPSVAGSSTPTLTSAESTSVSTGGTTHNITMPATVAAGDLLLAILTYGGGTTGNTPSGWTKIASTTYTAEGHTHGLAVFGKVADGTEDATNVNFTTSITCIAIGHVAAIDNWYGDLTGVEVGTFSKSISSVNPPSITQSWGSTEATMYVAVGTQADLVSNGNEIDISGVPTGYTGLRSSETEDITTDVDIALRTAYKTATAASEDPGEFAIDNTATNTGMGVTIAVRGAVVSTSYPNVASVTETVFPTDATSHAVVLPASNSGDLLICFFANDGFAEVTTPSGWTALFSEDNTAVRLSAYYKISDGSDSGSGALFRETSDHHPQIELTQYNPSDAVTSLSTVVLGGADEPQRLLVGRQTTNAQLLASDYSVAGTLHNDTVSLWGAIQTFTNDDLIILYANGALRTIAKTAAITDQPSEALSNVANGGFALGMCKLGGAPLRPCWVWPFEDTPDSMLEFGSERPGRVVFTNNEATDYQEIPMGMPEVWNAINIGGYAIIAHNKKRATYYDGTTAARDLKWVSDRSDVEADQTLELRGMVDNGSEVWFEVIKVTADADNPTEISRWWEAYNLETNSWYQVSARKDTTRTDTVGVLPSNKLPYSTTSQYIWTYTGDEWQSIYVPQYGYNPSHDLESHHHYEATATYTSPEWEIPGLEGWPKLVSRILFLGDVDSGGTGGTPATVIVRAGGMEATFATGLEGRAQKAEQYDVGDLFYTLQVEIELIRSNDVDTNTPNGLPVVVEGYAFIEALDVPSAFMTDTR